MTARRPCGCPHSWTGRIACGRRRDDAPFHSCHLPIAHAGAHECACHARDYRLTDKLRKETSRG